MTKNIVIAGTGFAGMWAAVSAARAISLAGKEDEVNVTIVSPKAELVIRPRLYETVFHEMKPDLRPLFDAVNVRHLSGFITTIRARDREVDLVDLDGNLSTLGYDKFILATGSKLFQPPVPGLNEYAFNVDQIDAAERLEAHLLSLAGKPETAARNTVVVAGGGFTGLETVAEMPERLRAIFGEAAKTRVVIVEQAPDIGPDLGPGPRPLIQEALDWLGVETITGAAVSAIEPGKVTLSTGESIETDTVVWTAGARANPLAKQLDGEHDRFGRLHVDAYLRAPDVADVYVTGDTAKAATDDLGNVAAMSCQHALSLGRVAGHNAAAELVGLPLHPYSQPHYVTCLDLGPWGALFTEGWDRKVKFQRDEGKAIKREINTKWIYPPAANRDEAFALAAPDHVIVAA